MSLSPTIDLVVVVVVVVNVCFFDVEALHPFSKTSLDKRDTPSV